MKPPALPFCARFAQLSAIASLAWIVFGTTTHGETNAAPVTSASPLAQATDISQIPGAHVTKTKDVVTGLSIDDCKVLTDADYKLIRQTETLTTIGLNRGLTDEQLKILAGMPALEAFGTNGAGVSDAVVASVLPTFKNLQSVTFFHPGPAFTGTGLAALAALPNVNNLTVAGSLAFADPGMAAVGKLSHLKAFRTWHSGVTVEGIKSLASLKELNNLMIGQRLANKPPATICDDAVAALATIPSLESINLGEARLSLPALSKLSQIPNLKILTLAGIDIPESDVNALKQQLQGPDQVDRAGRGNAKTDRRHFWAGRGRSRTSPAQCGKIETKYRGRVLINISA